jgi:hypothetical protein
MTIESIQHRLKNLEEAHAVLNKKIDGKEKTSIFDDIELQRLKKEKLCVKDKIEKLKSWQK